MYGGYGSMGMGGYGSMGGYGGGLGMNSGFGSYGGYGSYGGGMMGSGYGSSMMGGGYGSTFGGGAMGSGRHRRHFHNGGANQMNGDMMMADPLPPVPGNSGQGQIGNRGGNGGEVQTFGGAAPPNNSNETPEAKKARLRKQRRLRRAQRDAEREDHRMQRRAFFLSATMELLSHATQIVVHMLRSGYELASILFGTYYSVQAMRSFFASQQHAPNAAALVRDFTKDTAAAAAALGGAIATVAGKSVWLPRLQKLALLLGALSLTELLLRAHRARQAHQQYQQRMAERRVEELDDDELDEIYHEGEDEEGEESDSESDSLYDGDEGDEMRQQRGPRRAYVVTHDFTPTDINGDQLQVLAGDEVILEGPFASDRWCEAVITAADGTQRRGFVPGNFLKALTVPPKI